MRQGLWVFITALPVYTVNQLQGSISAPIGVLDILGCFLWIVGFAVEVIADNQKLKFNDDPNNKGKFINVGLWKISRHPNCKSVVLMTSILYFSSLTGIFRFWRDMFVVGCLSYRISRLHRVLPLGYHCLSLVCCLFVDQSIGNSSVGESCRQEMG